MGSVSYLNDSNKYADPMVSERAIDEPRPLKVIYIGAGASGICAAIQFPRHVPNIELVIYEKNPEVGGTWYENRSVCLQQKKTATCRVPRANISESKEC